MSGQEEQVSEPVSDDGPVRDSEADKSSPSRASGGSGALPRSGGADGTPSAGDGQDPSGSSSTDNLAEGDDGPGENRELDAVDDEVATAELLEENQQLRHMLAMRSVSGPLPDHEDLYKYTPDHQERIFRIAEAYSSDESLRRDSFQKAQITQSVRTQIITPILLVMFGVAAGVSFFVYENNVAGGLFLAMPVLRFLGTFVSTFAIRRRDKEDEDE